MNLNIHKLISIISYLNLPDKTLANYFVDFEKEKPLEEQKKLYIICLCRQFAWEMKRNKKKPKFN